MNWGYYIKQLREEAGITQQQLAVKSGVKRPHISNIERGVYKTYKPEILDRLAYGLGKNTRDLIDYIYRQWERPIQETSEQILERLRLAHPVTVPIYDEFRLHAGSPVEPMDYVSIVKDRARGRNLEGYIAQGNCLEPEVGSGDIIIVDRDGQPDVNNIVACLYKGELWLGRLKRIAGELWLENNEHRFKLEESPIVAPVIEVRRRLK